jgi:hypothetical protein
MSCQTVAKVNQATGLMPSTPWRACDLKVLPGWKLSVKFNDGLVGLVDISDLIYSNDPGIFSALRDPSYFALAYLDYGSVAWPNGADLAPETMYKAIRDSGIWRVPDSE